VYALLPFVQIKDIHCYITGIFIQITGFYLSAIQENAPQKQGALKIFLCLRI